MAFAAAIDDEEIAHLAQCQQRVMPHAACVVHALPAVRHERAQLARVQLTGRRHDHQVRLVVLRDEGLAAARVTLQHLHLERQRARLATEQADQRAAALAHIHVGEVMKARGRALVDGELLGPLQFDHVAERREGFARERLDGQGNARVGNCGGVLAHSSTPHKRRRDTPPSGNMLKRTCVTIPRSAISAS